MANIQRHFEILENVTTGTPPVDKSIRPLAKSPYLRNAARCSLAGYSTSVWNSLPQTSNPYDTRLVCFGIVKIASAVFSMRIIALVIIMTIDISWLLARRTLAVFSKSQYKILNLQNLFIIYGWYDTKKCSNLDLSASKQSFVLVSSEKPHRIYE